jgi:hypothetical protein
VVCPDEMLSEAIERSSFRSLQLAERQRKPSVSEGALHFRSGSSGQWETYFDDDDLVYYRELAAKYDVSIYP